MLRVVVGFINSLLVNRAPRITADNVARILLGLSVLCVMAMFVWLTSDVLLSGWKGLSLNFLVDSPIDSGRAGGIASILVSTLVVVGICLVVALPLGLAVAVWLSEFSDTGRAMHLAVWLRRLIHLLAGIPSIVIGLFGYVFFCQIMGLGYSLLAGGLSLACMILPLLIATMEESFRSTPMNIRQAAAALAISELSFIAKVLIPLSASALSAATILSLGRALAETAVLLFTSGYVTRMPDSINDPGRVLSVHIFDLSMNVTGGDQNAYSSALVLLFMLFVLNSFAKIILARVKIKL